MREADRDSLEPILFLLESPDIEVQHSACAALGNLAVDGEFIVLEQKNDMLMVNSQKWSLYSPARWPCTAYPSDEFPQCGGTMQCNWVHHKSSYA